MASNDAVKIADNITSDFAGNVQYQPDSRFWSTFPKNTANLISTSVIGLSGSPCSVALTLSGQPCLSPGLGQGDS